MKNLHLRALLIAATAVVGNAAHAQATWNAGWDLTSGCSISTSQTKCSSGSGVTKVDMTAKAYYSDAAGGKFAAGTINHGSGWTGVKSRDEGASETDSSPHHAMDNIGVSGSTVWVDGKRVDTGGADYAELLHLEFSKGVDLMSVVASWTGREQSSSYDGDFMVFRWDGTGSVTVPNILDFSATGVQAAGSGWSLVASKDFTDNKNQGIDSDKYSSHWLVTTAFGGTNDAFKLKSFSATVCAYTVNKGACTPPGSNDGGGSVPVPGTLALAALGVLGVMRQRRQPA